MTTIDPAALAVRLRGGETIGELSAEFGCSISTLARRLNDAGYRSNGAAGFVARTQPNQSAVRTPFVSHAFVADDQRLASGACVGHKTPDMWFPNTVRERAAWGVEAKRICRGLENEEDPAKSIPACPAREVCLSIALEEESVDGLRFGIRGGLDEAERAALVESGAA